MLILRYNTDYKHKPPLPPVINYNNKIFKTVSNTANGDTDENTIFFYKQVENFVTADYKGGTIKSGSLTATVDKKGCLQMQYRHTKYKNELLTGVFVSHPKILEDGRIRIFEHWQ